MMFSREDMKALSAILHERIDHVQLEEEILQDIEEELGYSDADIHSGFIEAGIDYLCKAEGVDIPVFSDIEIGKKIRTIKKATRKAVRKADRTREKRVIFGIGKSILAACIGIVIFISANFIYIEHTGKCLFNGMFNNMVCYMVGYPVKADIDTGMVPGADE